MYTHAIMYMLFCLCKIRQLATHTAPPPYLPAPAVEQAAAVQHAHTTALPANVFAPFSFGHEFNHDVLGAAAAAAAVPPHKTRAHMRIA